MIVLPIVDRELRVAARRKSVYRLRMAAGMVTLGLGGFFLALGDNLTAITTGTAGRTLFLIASFLLFGWALAAAHLTHDCVSGEKRDGTIGLLLLTDLNGFDIILGKLFALALPSFYAMLATAPLLMSAVLLGGVTGAEVWRTALALLNLFFFGQSVAIFSSTMVRERSAASGLTVLLLGFFVAGLFLIELAARQPVWLAEAFNPAFTFLAATRLHAVTSSSAFGLSLLTVHAASWVFLAAASLALPRLWHERPEKGIEAATSAAGPVAAGSNPFCWLVGRGMASPLTVWLVLGGLLLAGSFVLPTYRKFYPWGFVAGVVVLHFVLKAWVAFAVGRAMEEQRRTGSLEVLLSCTSLTVREILRGQWMALKRRFLGPAVGLLIVDAIIFHFTSYPIIRMTVLSAMLSLPLDLMTLRWLATWFAMSQRRPGRAGFKAICWVCLFPGLILMLPLLAQSADTEAAVFATLIGMFIDGMLFSISRDKVRVYLRTMASGEGGNDFSVGLLEEMNITERELALRG